jgi:hypothetical protein
MKERIYQDDSDFEYHDYSTEAEVMEKERQEERKFQKAQKESVSYARLTVFMIFLTIVVFMSLQGVAYILRRLFL